MTLRHQWSRDGSTDTDVPRAGQAPPGEPVLVGGQQSDALWAQLPSEVAALLRPHVALLAERIRAEIRAKVPDFVADDESRAMIMAAVSAVALRCEVAMGLVETPQLATGWQAPFHEIGRNAHRTGRSLESLQAAFRVAGRGSWQYMSTVLRDRGLSVDQLCASADALYATIDEITAIAADGYASASAPQAQRDPDRQRLLELLIGEGQAEADDLGRLAERAGWDLPRRVVAVALEPLPAGANPWMVLDAAVLSRLDGRRPCMITADPGRHLARLEQRLRGRRAAVGPSVPLDRASASLWCARRALKLMDDGLLPDRPLLDSGDHLLSMWLVAEPFLTTHLAEDVLAPLDDLPRPQAERLGRTLLEWLRHNGNSVDVAAALGVHPQTVRYRMNQLRPMFGSALGDPDARFLIELVLRAIRARGCFSEGEPGLSQVDANMA